LVAELAEYLHFLEISGRPEQNFGEVEFRLLWN